MSDRRLAAVLGLVAIVAASCAPSATLESSTTTTTRAAPPTTPTTVVDLPIQTGDETLEEKAAKMAQLIAFMTNQRWQGEPDENLYIFEYRRYHGEADPVAAGEPLDTEKAIEAGWRVCQAVESVIDEGHQGDDIVTLSMALTEVYGVPPEHAFAITYTAAAALCDPRETEWIAAGLSEGIESAG